MSTTTDTDTATKSLDERDASRRRPAGRARRFLARRDPLAWLLGGLALVGGAVFVIVNLAWNQGTFIAPLDDVYIHLQYGRQLGEGHPFEFNTGDPISTGASSLLYSFVLGAAYALGFQDGAFLGFAVGLGVVCTAFATGLAYHLGRVLVNRTVGIWTGALVALSGPLLWGAASGMEVGLTAFLATATVYSFVRERPLARFRLTPLVGGLLALVRPEGMVLALMLSGAMVWTVFAARRDEGRFRAGRALWCLFPLVPVAGQYLFYLLATGTFTANGVQSKSYLNDQPVFYLGEFVDRTVDNLRQAVGFFNGMIGQNYAFPGMVVAFLLGLAYLFATRRRWRPLLVALALGFAGIVVSVSTLSTALVHELRYFQPFLPLYILFAVCGLYAVSRVVQQQRYRRIALHSLLTVALLFSLAALPTWAVRFGWESATIRDTDVSAAAWVRGNLPDDAVIGVKDVGAVAYLGGHRVVDTIGLATNGFAEASNNGTGSLYEQLRKLPAAERPDYFVVYETPPGASMRPFLETGIFESEPEITFELRSPRDETGWSIVPFNELMVYRADWTLVGTGDRAPRPGDVRDYVNVGDLDSEEQHGYAAEMEQPRVQPYTQLRRQGDVIDSGRYILGGETFTARNLEPGRPMTITSRVLPTGPERFVRVRVDGRDLGIWNLGPRGEQWNIRTFTVPGDAVKSAEAEVRLEPVRPLLSPYPEYTSFGYWISQ